MKTQLTRILLLVTALYWMGGCQAPADAPQTSQDGLTVLSASETGIAM